MGLFTRWLNDDDHDDADDDDDDEDDNDDDEFLEHMLNQSFARKKNGGCTFHRNTLQT